MRLTSFLSNPSLTAISVSELPSSQSSRTFLSLSVSATFLACSASSALASASERSSCHRWVVGDVNRLFFFASAAPTMSLKDRQQGSLRSADEKILDRSPAARVEFCRFTGNVKDGVHEGVVQIVPVYRRILAAKLYPSPLRRTQRDPPRGFVGHWARVGSSYRILLSTPLS